MDVYSGDFLGKTEVVEDVAMTIGNFDGVHRGHRYLISQLNEGGLQSLILSFSPHPSHIVGKKPIEHLFSDDDREKALDSCGVDSFVIQDFTPEFANLSAEDFLRQYLFPVFKPKRLLLGHDFSFGRGGEGNLALAESVAKEYRCEVRRSEPFKLKGEIVSSTLIRESLRRGDVGLAMNCLNRRYYLEGRVTSGEGLGRQLGFPTANISGISTLVPGNGVYGGIARINDQDHTAVLNIGVRPTVSAENMVTVECYILDFNEDIYNKDIKFIFFDKIRDEKRFNGKSELINQISKDVEQVKSMMKRNSLIE